MGVRTDRHSAVWLVVLLALGLADLAWINLSLAPQLVQHLASETVRETEQSVATQTTRHTSEDANARATISRKSPVPTEPSGSGSPAKELRRQTQGAAGSEGVEEGAVPHGTSHDTEAAGVPVNPRVARPLPVLPHILFDTASATLDARARQVLRQAVRVLDAQLTVRLHLRGFADQRGTDDLNLRLSQARAEKAQQYITAQGIAAERLTTEGLGTTKPLDNHQSPSAWAKNRRVELIWR